MDKHPVPPAFLTDVYSIPPPSSFTNAVSPRLTSPDPNRPYVTLTFAQSLDGKIAGTGGKQLALSGRESLVMTHWMRTMHDGIMVGIGTALNDDPQLNTRHLPTSETPYHIPRPIILDSSLRLSPHCKVLKNFAAGTGRRPWIMCSLDQLHCHHSESGPGRADRKKALQEAGARVIEVSGSDGLLSITDVLRQLRNLGIHSLMVEGGARVIGSFLSEVSSSCVTDPATAQPYRDEGRGVVDMLVVTVAPTFVGDDGIGYGIDMSGNQVPSIEHVRTEVIGRDAVFAVRPKTGLVATT